MKALLHFGAILLSATFIGSTKADQVIDDLQLEPETLELLGLGHANYASDRYERRVYSSDTEQTGRGSFQSDFGQEEEVCLPGGSCKGGKQDVLCDKLCNARLDAAEQECACCRGKSERQEIRIKELESDNNRLTIKVSSLQSENQRLKDDNASFQKEVYELKRQITEL